MNLSYSWKAHTKWADFPFTKKVAIVELRNEMRNENPDPYQSSLDAFRKEDRRRRQKIKKHVAKIMELRHEQG